MLDITTLANFPKPVVTPYTTGKGRERERERERGQYYKFDGTEYNAVKPPLHNIERFKNFIHVPAVYLCDHPQCYQSLFLTL